MFDGWGRMINIHRGYCLDMTPNGAVGDMEFLPCAWDSNQFWTSSNDLYIQMKVTLSLMNLKRASYCLTNDGAPP
jgi:hypothetical protein